MAAPTHINTWQMYAKDGRAVFIIYDYENAPLGVTKLPGNQPSDLGYNLDVYYEAALSPSWIYDWPVETGENSAWATADINIGPVAVGGLCSRMVKEIG